MMQHFVHNFYRRMLSTCSKYTSNSLAIPLKMKLCAFTEHDENTPSLILMRLPCPKPKSWLAMLFLGKRIKFI